MSTTPPPTRWASEDPSEEEERFRSAPSFVQPTQWLDWEEVWSSEKKSLEQRRRHWKKLGVEISEATLGVCFSGGGIRSADICLGAVWRLAEEGLLPHVSWISAVSGGAFASAAFTTDVLQCWAERGPSGPSNKREVDATYREAARRTVLRFQEQANYPLQPFKWFAKLPCIWARRLLGIMSFAMLLAGMLLMHPLSFVVWAMLPLVIYFRMVHGAALRLEACSPPFHCLDQDCSSVELSEADGWRIFGMLLTPSTWTGNRYVQAAICIGTLLVVFRLAGCLQEERREPPNRVSCATPSKCMRTFYHFLHGANMLVKRTLVLFVLEALILTLVLATVIQDYGDVTALWHLSQGQGSRVPAVPSGWDLGIDPGQEIIFQLGTAATNTSNTQVGNAQVLHLQMWYTCYRYAMSHWQAMGWLSVVGSTEPPTTIAPAPEVQSCTDPLGQPSSIFANTPLGNRGRNWTGSQANPWWNTWAIGAYYWGHANGTVGRSPEGQGAASKELTDFYQAWYEKCDEVGEGMCFVPPFASSTGRTVTGCCQARFTPLLVWAAVGLLGLSLVAFLLTKTKVMFTMILMLAGPFAALYILSSLITWRVFGPLAKSVSDTSRFYLFLEYVPFSLKAWNALLLWTMIFAVLLMPAFGIFQRMAHLYNKACLVNAFFYGGQDVLLAQCAQHVACPELLFGATMLLYRSKFQGAHGPGRFSIGTSHLGSAQTRYIVTPEYFQLGRAMTCSAAAMDTFLLTDADHWSIRFWILMLNLAQGDWLRVDPATPFQLPLSLAGGNLLRVDRWQRAVDTLPITLVFMLCYALALFGERAASGDDSSGCGASRSLIWTAFLITAGVFISIFFTPICRLLMMLLQPSPLVRAVTMMLVITPVTSEEPPPYLYLGDGGLLENSGCLELLLRKARFILVFESGDDPKMELITLKLLLKYTAEEKVCSFYVPDDSRRSVVEAMEDYVENPTRTFLHLKIQYDWGQPTNQRTVGDLFWVQNRPGGPEGWLSSPAIRRFEPREGAPSSSCPVCCGSNRPGPLRPEAVSESDSEEPSWSTRSASSNERPASCCCNPHRHDNEKLKDMSGCCWDGCCFPFGSFPTTVTVNQSYSPQLAANYIHYGYHLSHDAVEAFKAANAAASQR